MLSIPVTLVLSQQQQDIRQQASGGCTYKFISGVGFLCVANEGASSDPIESPPHVPDNMSVTDGNTTYVGQGGYEMPETTIVLGRGVTPTLAPTATATIAPSPQQSPTVTPKATPTGGSTCGQSTCSGSTPNCINDYYSGVGKCCPTSSVYACNGKCQIDKCTTQTQTTDPNQKHGAIHHISCQNRKAFTDRVRIIMNYLDDSLKACSGNPVSTSYFQSLPITTYPNPTADSNNINCKPTKVSYYYEGLPSGSLYKPTHYVNANGSTITLSSDLVNKTAIIPLSAMDINNPVNLYITAPDTACAPTAAGQPLDGGQPAAGDNTGIVDPADQNNTNNNTNTQNPTCDPDKTSASLNKIDNADFVFWLAEFLGTKTSKGADCKSDQIIDIFDFNMLRDMRKTNGWQ